VMIASTAMSPSLFGASPTLLLAVLSASLLGSVHCMGMCGPFVAVVSGAKHSSAAHVSSTQKAMPQLAYHLGRAATYIGLGAAGGSVGAVVDFAGEAAGVVHVAALLSGVLVILWGTSLIFPRLSLSSPLERFFGRRLSQLGTRPKVFRASMLGVLTPLLPCGWLYAFVMTAVGTGTLTGGGLVMAVFWLGTVPALVGMGAILSRLSVRLRARLPVASGVALIAIGIFGVTTKMAHPSPSAHGHSTSIETVPEIEGASCH
jgi:sulfite exporter TauE/SafE